MQHPYDEASLLSRLTFFWARNLGNHETDKKARALPRALRSARTQPVFNRLLARHGTAFHACLGSIRYKWIFPMAGVLIALAECADVLVIYKITDCLENARALTRPILARIARLLALHVVLTFAELPLPTLAHSACWNSALRSPGRRRLAA